MISKRLIALILSVFLLYGILNAQNDKLVNSNQFEVNLSNGVLFNKVETQLGEDYYVNCLSPCHSIIFNYRRLLSESFSVYAGWGFGFQSHRFRDINNNNHLSGFFQFRVNSGYNIHHTIQIGTSYSTQVSDKLGVEFDIGGGIKQAPGAGYGYGGVDGEGISLTYLELNHLSHVVPFATVGVSLTKDLKNQNILKFGVNYNQGFRNIYEGTFNYTTPLSSGTIYSKGSCINLRVGYTFTGNERREKLSDRLDSGDDRRIAIKEVRKERRYFSPQSTFVSVLGGVGLGINRLDKSDGILKSSRQPGLSTGIYIEQGIKNNFFAECGYQLLEYQDMITIQMHHISSFGSNAFVAHEFSLGGGYRLISKNNYPFFNVRIGLKGGFTPEGIGISSSGSGSSSGNLDDGTTYFYNVSSSDEVESKLLCAVYAGISKDFRILDRFYLTFDYRYQQGFNTIYTTDISYETSLFEGTRNAVKTIDGSAHFIQFGLKFKVGQIKI